MTTLVELAHEELSELPEDLATMLSGLSDTALAVFYAERHTLLSHEDIAAELGLARQNVDRAADTARRRLEGLLRPPESHVQRSLAEGEYDYPGNAWELPRGSTERRLTAGGEPPRFDSLSNPDKRS